MNGQKTVRKLFWAWEFEKEEQWLNTMAQAGWALEKVGLCQYSFSPCEPGEYTIRLEMRSHDEGYLAFMQETGAEYIGRMVQWIYFRKKATEGGFDIFSDLDSKIKHLKSISRTLLAVGGANLAVGVANSFLPVSIGWINLLLASFLMYGVGRIHGKVEALKNQRLLVE